MGTKVRELLLVLMLNILHGAYSDHILPCNASLIEPCLGQNQVCNVTTLECDCIEGFVLIGDDCESSESIEDHGDHSTTTAVVTIFALVLIALGLVLVIKKYNLIEYARQKMNWRRNHDVMYEDVMIGSDDPPLNP